MQSARLAQLARTPLHWQPQAVIVRVQLAARELLLPCLVSCHVMLGLHARLVQAWCKQELLFQTACVLLVSMGTRIHQGAVAKRVIP